MPPPGPERKNAQHAAHYWIGLVELFREHGAAWDVAGDLHPPSSPRERPAAAAYG
jgi:hypothetical protein